MTKEDTDLIGEAIDFYNLNHFKGKETKKRLVKLKKELKQFVIHVVGVRSEQLITEKLEAYFEEYPTDSYGIDCREIARKVIN